MDFDVEEKEKKLRTGKVGTMAPTMYLAFVTNYYLDLFGVEGTNGIPKLEPNEGIDEHVVYALVSNSSNLAPEKMHEKMDYAV